MRLPFGLREVEEFEREVGDPRIAQVDDGLGCASWGIVHSRHTWVVLYTTMPSMGYKLDGLCPRRDLVGPTHKHCSPLLQCVCVLFGKTADHQTRIYMLFSTVWNDLQALSSTVQVFSIPICLSTKAWCVRQWFAVFHQSCKRPTSLHCNLQG